MKKKIVLKIAIIIGILSLFLIPSTYAIFRGVIGSSSSLVLASWNTSLNESGVNNYLSIVPEPNNTDASYTLNITNNSEVDIIYTIIIDNIPTGVSVKLGNGQFVQETNHKVIFSNAGTIYYNGVSRTESCLLTFKASSSASYVNDHEIDISVIVSQPISNS